MGHLSAKTLDLSSANMSFILELILKQKINYTYNICITSMILHYRWQAFYTYFIFKAADRETKEEQNYINIAVQPQKYIYIKTKYR